MRCRFLMKVGLNSVVFFSRVDKISEADFRTANSNHVKNSHQPSTSATNKEETSFLWTLGPRPFWELWPYKKHKKKKLSLEEFIQCLLEQWAVTHHYPVELASRLTLHKDQKYVTKERFNNHKICKFLAPNILKINFLSTVML